MVHCANFWKWFVVPGFVFLLEKIVGIAVSRMGGLHIVEVNLLPSKVRKTHSPFAHSSRNQGSVARSRRRSTAVRLSALR